ncbi:MAG: glycosyl hydrolase family 28-related protein [Phycisphaerales bacterium]
MKTHLVSILSAISMSLVIGLLSACHDRDEPTSVPSASAPKPVPQAAQPDTTLGRLPPQLIEWVKAKQSKDSFELVKPYLAYCYPPMNEPVFEGFTLKVPSVLGNQELAKIGLVDVTAEPFNADPTGVKDSTQALQNAVNFARDHQMVCFLPPGTYTISDTLECIQNLAIRDNGRIVGASQYPCILMGSREQPDKRPVIRLADHAPGFNDPKNRKCAVLFWSRNCGMENRKGRFTEGPDIPQSNIGFNQVFMDIDITIGKGNGGAVGISMRAAEGSTIQDVTIDATHGDTGVLGVSGSGGSHANITVIGGRVGIDIRGFPPQDSQNDGGSQPGPTLTHITLLHQTDKAMISRAVGSLTAVGWKIVFDGAGPMMDIENFSWTCGLGSAGFIDSQFIFETPNEKNTVFSIKRGIVLENVFVKNGKHLADDITLNPTGWSRISRAALPLPIGLINVYEVGKIEQTEYPYVNGTRVDHSYLEPITDTEPPANLCSRHIWPDDFPNWQTPGAANVKAPPYNAKGDSVTDDTRAIQKAIDEHDIVFLPKGYYRLTDTLKLKPRTQLIGLIHPFTVLMVRDAWGKLAAAKPMPMVESPDDADADTTLAFLGVSVSATYDKRRNPAETAGVYGLEWRAGAHSMVRQVAAMFAAGDKVPPEDETEVGFTYPWAHITGRGGGRWYNFHVMERLSKFRPGYRHLLVENTTTPLAIYHLHAQHSMPEFGAELRHASHVSIYGCKQECTAKVSFMKISYCRNVRVFGLSGWAMPSPGKANFDVDHSDDFLIAGYAPFEETRSPTKFEKDPWIDYPTGRTNVKDFFPITDQPSGGGEVKVSPFDIPLLYIRGTPSSW